MTYKFSDWKCLRWETPISDAESVTMELLLNGKLEVILDSTTVFHSSPNIKITFGKSDAFRSLQESYMNVLWDKFAETGRPGRSFIVEDSPWISELAEQDGFFAEILKKGARHYVIATDAEVLEVISRFPPHIETL